MIGFIVLVVFIGICVLYASVEDFPEITGMDDYLDVAIPVKIFITGTEDNITVNACVGDESWTLDARFPSHKTWSQVDRYRHLGDRIQFVFDDKSVWTLVVRIKPEME